MAPIDCPAAVSVAVLPEIHVNCMVRVLKENRSFSRPEAVEYPQIGTSQPPKIQRVSLLSMTNANDVFPGGATVGDGWRTVPKFVALPPPTHVQSNEVVL